MTEDQAVVGARVQVLVDLLGVPWHTQGVVDEDYGTGVMVAWDLPDRPLPADWRFDVENPRCWANNPKAPLRDGFNKDTELDLLELVEAP